MATDSTEDTEVTEDEGVLALCDRVQKTHSANFVPFVVIL